MKEYKITIQIEEVKKSSSYMSKMLAEVEQEKREIKIAKDLNTAAGQIRKKYFQELLDTINDELSDLGVHEFEIGWVKLGTNDIHIFRSNSVWIGDQHIKLTLEPRHDMGAGYPTRYVTSTQNFSILLKRGNFEEVTLKVDDILGDFFSKLERNIKLHLHNK
jgi:hypothetical protein